MSLEVSVMPKRKKRYNKDLISYRPLVSLISIYISMTESYICIAIFPKKIKLECDAIELFFCLVVPHFH